MNISGNMILITSGIGFELAAEFLKLYNPVIVTAPD
jgi:short-subunit dehydrogenase involved in D-alanine esterification of teichoic acids